MRVEEGEIVVFSRSLSHAEVDYFCWASVGLDFWLKVVKPKAKRKHSYGQKQ